MRQAMMQATRRAARASGGRPVSAASLHVTLAFLGSVPERRLPELAEVARGAAEAAREPARAGAGPSGNAFELSFDRLEHWRGARLLCAALAEPPAWVAALTGELQDLLTGHGFNPDLTSSWSVAVDIIKPFRPHVTLARKVYRLPRAVEMQPVTWSFKHFVLVDSKTLPEGPIYTVLERFSLDQ